MSSNMPKFNMYVKIMCKKKKIVWMPKTKKIKTLSSALMWHSAKKIYKKIKNLCQVLDQLALDKEK